MGVLCGVQDFGFFVRGLLANDPVFCAILGWLWLPCSASVFGTLRNNYAHPLGSDPEVDCRPLVAHIPGSLHSLWSELLLFLSAVDSSRSTAAAGPRSSEESDDSGSGVGAMALAAPRHHSAPRGQKKASTRERESEVKYDAKVRNTPSSQPASFDLFDWEDVGGMRPQPLAGVPRHASRDLKHHVPMLQVLVVLVPQMVDAVCSSGSCSSSTWSSR